MSLISF